MAIANDSFGSPSLGEGIGLQGTLKDYTPSIIKGIMAGQERKAKAEQKKLDDDLKKQADEDELFGKFKFTGGRFRAFDKERLRLADQWLSKVQELKSSNKPIANNLELKRLEWELQTKFDKIKELEDRYADEYAFISKHSDPEVYPQNVNIMQALDNPDENAYKALAKSGGDVYNYAGPLYSKYTPIDINKFAKTMAQDRIKPSISFTEADVKQYQGVNDKAAFLSTQVNKVYDDKEKQKLIDEFRNSSELDKWLNQEQRYWADQGQLFDRNARKEAQVEIFKSSLQDELRQKLQQIYESKDAYGPGADQPGKDINISYTDNAGDQISYLRPIAESTVEKRLKAEFDKYKNGETTDFFESIGLGVDETSRKETTFDKFKLKIEKYNSTQSDDNKKIADVDKIIKILSGSILSKYSNRPGINVVRTNAPQNKDFKGVKDGKGNNINAAFMSFIPADKSKGLPAVFLVLRDEGQGNYTITEVPASDHNKSVYGPEFRIDPKVKTNDFDYWFNKKKSDAASNVGGESINKAYGDGGKIEPKSVSQKYHNKSKNLTKFVYSDGSEEVFNGIL